MHGTQNLIRTKAKRQPNDKRKKIQVYRYVRKAQRRVKGYVRYVERRGAM